MSNHVWCCTKCRQSGSVGNFDPVTADCAKIVDQMVRDHDALTPACGGMPEFVSGYAERTVSLRSKLSFCRVLVA